MPGGDPTKVHVAGTCTVPSSSVVLTLEPGDEGIDDDPALIALELKSSRPDIGDDKMTDKQVIWDGPAESSVVRVRIQGEASANLAVRDVWRSGG
jgi:hypothetical protein